jgi:glycosyltransferase involved in cell wall biosynthesis
VRILAVTNLYPNPAQPHRATFNRHQFQLLNQDHPLHVIAPVAWTERRRFAKTAIPFRTTLDGITVDHPTYYFTPRVGRRYYGPMMRRSIRNAFHRAIVEFQTEIVFAPWIYPDGWAAWHLAREQRLPVVLQAHGSDVKLLQEHPGRRAGTIQAACNADGVVAVSHDIARDLAQLGVPRERILVNHDGVDPALFHPGDRAAAKAKLNLMGKPVVLFVGNLVAVKAVDRLFKACGGLKVKLVIVGEGPLKAPLQQLAKQRMLDVTWTGAIPLETLPDYYRAADCFVLPSRSEGVPNVLLEASACGTPWVASNVGGIGEIAHLGPSTLVPSGDIAALRSAIEVTLREPPRTELPPQRLRQDAVNDLAAFLQMTAFRFRTAYHPPHAP